MHAQRKTCAAGEGAGDATVTGPGAAKCTGSGTTSVTFNGTLNSITVNSSGGQDTITVQQTDVPTLNVANGSGTVTVVEGGLEIPNDAGTDSMILAHAAAIVRLDV